MFDKHATTLAERLARDKQLSEYVNTAQQGNQVTFDLLAAQLASVGDSKQFELAQKVDNMVSTLRGQLQQSDRELYEQVVNEICGIEGANLCTDFTHTV